MLLEALICNGLAKEWHFKFRFLFFSFSSYRSHFQLLWKGGGGRDGWTLGGGGRGMDMDNSILRFAGLCIYHKDAAPLCSIAAHGWHTVQGANFFSKKLT